MEGAKLGDLLRVGSYIGIVKSNVGFDYAK